MKKILTATLVGLGAILLVGFVVPVGAAILMLLVVKTLRLIGVT